jgi:hypothetical protein
MKKKSCLKFPYLQPFSLSLFPLFSVLNSPSFAPILLMCMFLYLYKYLHAGELKHRFTMLRRLVPEDSALARVCRLMTQQWEGDVTVVVEGFFYPLGKLITDPT